MPARRQPNAGKRKFSKVIINEFNISSPGQWPLELRADVDFETGRGLTLSTGRVVSVTAEVRFYPPHDTYRRTIELAEIAVRVEEKGQTR